MTSPSPQYPFYFAWVDADQRTFDASTMAVVDEDIISFEIRHEEGQIPTLDIDIKNPRIGLLNPGRKVWAWLSEQTNSGVVPLFFGVLVGVPSNVFNETVTLKFIARPRTYIQDKQAVAEGMKIRPYYDPVFLDEQNRDHPDAILEGWSALWHVDRTTLAVTASDILAGEDGTETFTEDDAFYEGVGLTIGQAPLTNIRVEANVHWTQRQIGFVEEIDIALNSYTGGTFMSEWPKPGAALGGGWTCETSWVNDTYAVEQTPQANYSYSWRDTAKDKLQCNPESVSLSSSYPALLAPNSLAAQMTIIYNTGICDPYATPPSNWPAHISSSGIIVPLWNLQCRMTMRYNASREFTEALAFDVTLNSQGILTSPTVDQDTELLTISGQDVGKPLLELDAWSDFKSQAVSLAQMIFPNNPTTPGGLSYQICVVAGVAGATEPVFSDIPGTITYDGSVQWASMGTSPLTSQPDWTDATPVPLGEIICFQEKTFNTAIGDWEDVPNSTSYYICTTPGTTNSEYTTFTYTPPTRTTDEATPAPVTMSSIERPRFSTTVGDLIDDGTVQWTCLGQSPTLLGIPIGGTPNNVTARSYFPSDRGLWSVEHLICKARARLRLRSRCVKLSWDCTFDKARTLSCRKNATLYDPRLPGGVATGKITNYSLKASGDGKVTGHVEIGCAIGYGDSVSEITGTPEYAAAGYCQDGYQLFDGATIKPDSGDISYTPPVFGAFDDGLVFPLKLKDISDGGVFSGTVKAQKAAIEAAFPISRMLAESEMLAGLNLSSNPNGSTQVSGISPTVAWTLERAKLFWTAFTVPYVMEANPISWAMLLKPVTGMRFDGSYSINVTPLEVPKGIDLEAASSP